MAGLVLILLAIILILIGLLVSFRILPGMHGKAAGGEFGLEPHATRIVPPTPPYIRNAILMFSGLVSLMLIAVGLWLVIQDQSHKFQIDDALQLNRDRLTQLASTPAPASPTAPAPSATPVRTNQVSPTPGGTVAPTPTAAATRVSAHDLFSSAIELDKAGKNTAAITAYKAALSSGLDQSARQAAQLEIGLLSLLAVKDGDRDSCPDSVANLRTVASSAPDEKTRTTANDALRQALKLCG